MIEQDLSRFDRARADYEAPQADLQNAAPGDAEIPFCRGQDLRGKSILLSEPNGLGDTLQFFRFVTELVRRGARVTFLESRPSLRKILGDFGAQVRFVERLDEPRFDFPCWLWNLAHYLRIHSMDQLSAATPFRGLPDAVEIRQLKGIDEGADPFVDSAAALQTLDLLVTADTSVTHVAGATDRPVWLALNTVSDWRWMLDRSDSPWYPTFHLFRQARPGDWSTVFKDMADSLGLPVPGRLAMRQG